MGMCKNSSTALGNLMYWKLTNFEPISDKKAHRSSASPAYDNINVYTLFAVVNHQGKMDTGHYTMFAKHRGQVKISEDVFILFSFIN